MEERNAGVGKPIHREHDHHRSVSSERAFSRDTASFLRRCEYDPPLGNLGASSLSRSGHWYRVDAGLSRGSTTHVFMGGRIRGEHRLFRALRAEAEGTPAGLVSLEQRLEDRARKSQPGRRTVKIAPPPSRFCAAICPPWASTSALAIASPSRGRPDPTPSRRGSRLWSGWGRVNPRGQTLDPVAPVQPPPGLPLAYR